MYVYASITLSLRCNLQWCLIGWLHVQGALCVLFGPACYDAHAVVLEVAARASSLPQVLLAHSILVSALDLFYNGVRCCHCLTCVSAAAHLMVNHCALLVTGCALLQVLLVQNVLVLLIY